MATTTLARQEPITVARTAWWRKSRYEATIAFILMMAPMVLGLFVFTFIPIVWGGLLSFSTARNSIDIGNWVGFDNYAYVLGNSEFRKSLRTIAIFAVFIVPITMFLSLGLALLVNSIGVGRSFFRTAFFIPTAISYVVASIVWKASLFSGLPYGFANMVLYWFGSDQIIAWIGETSPPWYWLVLVSVRLWLQVGFYMIIFLAGLQEIDESLYEAAYVDGGKPGWSTFWTITFPMLRNTTIAVGILNLIAAFQAFDEFMNILGGVGSGGNMTLARPPLVWLYQTSIGGQEYGRGSAGAFVLTAIIIFVTVVQGRIFGFGRKA